jgi:hypothetical protein
VGKIVGCIVGINEGGKEGSIEGSIVVDVNIGISDGDREAVVGLSERDSIGSTDEALYRPINKKLEAIKTENDIACTCFHKMGRIKQIDRDRKRERGRLRS